jgi:hypothetical protein
MTKAKFGDSVRSRTDMAMKNEVFAKFIAHNVCVIMSQLELGIDPIFWGEMVNGPQMDRVYQASY